jgi:aryl-alcohol dehydrogenase-like predicted oxidoreductase
MNVGQVVSALLKSVARGWNVIDTARNYRRGRAEAAVGEALMTLTRQGLRREQLFISTKAGYPPGARRSQRASRRGLVAVQAMVCRGHC